MTLPAVADTRADLDLAKAFSESKMVPDHFKKSVGDCYIAIQLARRYRMDAWSLMQEMYIIQGRAMMSGKLATAILNNSLAEPLRPEYSGEGDERTITVTGRPEGDLQRSVTLRVKDARTNNENWKKMPDQMLMYAASRMWGRRYTPDILLGIVFDDEEIEPPQFSTKAPTPIAAPKPDAIDQLTGEIYETPVRIERHEGEKQAEWARRLYVALRPSPDIDTIDRWLAENSEGIADCLNSNRTTHANFLKAVNELKAKLLDAENTR